MKKINTLKLLAILIFALNLMFTSVTPTIANQTGTITTENTNTGIRMQPIYERLRTITQDNLQSIIKSYKDLSTHWSKTHAATLISLEIMSGTGKGIFEPNGTLTTEQFITMLVRSMGYKPESIPGASWSAPYIKIALDEGIIKEDEFKKYNTSISREQAVNLSRKMLGKFETIPHDYYVSGDDWASEGNKGLFDNVYAGYQIQKMYDYIYITDKYKQDVIDCYRMGTIT